MLYVLIDKKRRGKEQEKTCGREALLSVSLSINLYEQDAVEF
jgi:hypothetical protein